MVGDINIFYELKARLQSSHLPCLGESCVSSTPGEQNQLHFSLIKLAKTQISASQEIICFFFNILTFGLCQTEMVVLALLLLKLPVS